MTQQKAKELCIKKWEYIYNIKSYKERKNKRYPELPEFDKYLSGCPYCELYIKGKGFRGICFGCPLNLKGTTCFDTNHPWNKWFGRPTKKNTKIVLDLIKNN